MAEMKNQKLLNKALNLLPDLVFRRRNSGTKSIFHNKIKLGTNIQNLDHHIPERISPWQAVDYRKRVLKKGSRVCLDFGNHQVGYLTLNLNYRGSHPDAPVWLKLHFAENATELFEDGKSYQGWICSSWIEEEQLHVDVVPSQLRLKCGKLLVFRRRNSGTRSIFHNKIKLGTNIQNLDHHIPERISPWQAQLGRNHIHMELFLFDPRRTDPALIAFPSSKSSVAFSAK